MSVKKELQDMLEEGDFLKDLVHCEFSDCLHVNVSEYTFLWSERTGSFMGGMRVSDAYRGKARKGLSESVENDIEHTLLVVLERNIKQITDADMKCSTSYDKIQNWLSFDIKI